MGVHEGVLKKSLQAETEFVVEMKSAESAAGSEKDANQPFMITPESLDSLPQSVLANVPKFKISGILHRSVCPIGMPFTGKIKGYVYCFTFVSFSNLFTCT